MPTISRFYGIDIRMYWDDRHGPHFHAAYGEDVALISILNGEFLGGDLPRRIVRLTESWRKLRRLSASHQELLENWERARNRQALKQIKGLP